MLLLTSRMQAGRAAGALLAAVVYAAGIGLVPVLHASWEVAGSAAAVEGSHSDGCPQLHGGTACAAVAGLTVGQTGQRAAMKIRKAVVRVGATRANERQHPAPPAHSTTARAPPLA